MANINPESQKRLNLIVKNFENSLNRMRDDVTKAQLAFGDLAFELDDANRKQSADIVTQAIEKATK